MADDETGTATGGDSTDSERDAASSTDATATTTDTQTSTRDDDALQKALRSERQMRASAEKRLKALEDAQKTDLEKATERATTAEARAHVAEQRLLRTSIAAEFSLSPAMADRLRGDDEDAMRKDAQVLVAELDPEGDLGTRRGGSRGKSKDDPNASLRAMFGR